MTYFLGGFIKLESYVSSMGLYGTWRHLKDGKWQFKTSEASMCLSATDGMYLSRIQRTTRTYIHACIHTRIHTHKHKHMMHPSMYV